MLLTVLVSVRAETELASVRLHNPIDCFSTVQKRLDPLFHEKDIRVNVALKYIYIFIFERE